MGLKKLFRFKPPPEETVEENRFRLNELGVSTKNPAKKRKEKFAAYGQFAREREHDKFYAPPGYENYAFPNDGTGEDGTEGEEDLNESKVDGESGNSPAREKSSRKGLFGRKPKLEEPLPASPAKNPYAIISNYGDSGTFSDPYSSFRSQSDGSRIDQSANRYTHEPALQANLNSDPYAVNTATSSNPSPYDGLNETSFNSPLSVSRPRVAPRVGGQSFKSNPSRSQSHATLHSDTGYNSYQTSSTSYSNLSSDPYHSIPSKSTSPVSTAYSAKSNSNPYAGMDMNELNRKPSMHSSNPYGRRSSNLPGRQSSTKSIRSNNVSEHDGAMPAPVPLTTAGTIDYDLDLNMEPRQDEFRSQKIDRSNIPGDYDGILNDPDAITQMDDELDLNEAPVVASQQQQQQLQYEQPQEQVDYWAHDEVDNLGYHETEQKGFKTFEELQQEEEQKKKDEEEEEVDEIKQEIKFVKQSSLASTRNTLKMAKEAEMAGMNSLGILGHQSERLGNIQTNLDLMKAQNKVATDDVDKLKSLNRNIFAVHVKNPFNSKRRQQEREDKLKARKMEEKLMQEQTLGDVTSSTKRIEDTFNHVNGEDGTVRERYKREEILKRAQKYQFENDEEDDAMEVEIDRNLDSIKQISGRLKKMAVASGQELDAQQSRIRKIEEDTDALDIDIHLNTAKLSYIR